MKPAKKKSNRHHLVVGGVAIPYWPTYWWGGMGVTSNTTDNTNQGDSNGSNGDTGSAGADSTGQM